MKQLLSIGLLLISSAALADSFTIIRDGNEYLCQQISSHPNPPPVIDPGAGMNCANKAYDGPFSKDEAKALCEGALNDAPADCGIIAYNGPFAKSEAIRICKYAKTEGPADCAVAAYNGPFSKEEAMTLCSRTGSIANSNCAIKAYNGAYSKEEAIRLCRTEPQLVLKALMMTEQFSTKK